MKVPSTKFVNLLREVWKTFLNKLYLCENNLYLCVSDNFFFYSFYSVQTNIIFHATLQRELWSEFTVEFLSPASIAAIYIFIWRYFTSFCAKGLGFCWCKLHRMTKYASLSHSQIVMGKAWFFYLKWNLLFMSWH